jgi:hypothetical protein
MNLPDYNEFDLALMAKRLARNAYGREFAPGLEGMIAKQVSGLQVQPVQTVF